MGQHEARLLIQPRCLIFINECRFISEDKALRSTFAEMKCIDQTQNYFRQTYTETESTPSMLQSLLANYYPRRKRTMSEFYTFDIIKPTLT